MDLLLSGPPGPLFRWSRDLVLFAAKLRQTAIAHNHVGGDHVWTPHDRNEDIERRLLTSDCPGDELVVAVRENRLAALVVLDQPVHSVIELRSTGVEFTQALRHSSASAACLGQLGRGGALVLTRNWVKDADRLMRTVLNFAGLDASPEVLAVLPRPPPAAGTIPLSQDEIGLVESVLVPAFRYAATGIRQTVAWPRACLFWGDYPGKPAPRVIDMAGPARALVYGPYLYLPPGRWTARATLAFSQSCQGAELALEVHGRAEFGRGRFCVPQAGVFAVTCPITVPSEREALEIRLVTERGAIEGTLAIDRIELTPEPTERDQSVA